MKLIVIAFVIAIVSSCTTLFPVPELPIDRNEIQTSRDAIAWVSTNIDYSDSPVYYYQTPHETIELGTGMCADYSTLALYLIYEYTGEKWYYYVIDLPNVIDNHALIGDGGTQLIDPQNRAYSAIDTLTVLKVYTYDEIMKKISYAYYIDGKE